MQVSEGGDAHHMIVVLNDVVDILSLVNSPITQRVTRRRLKQKPDIYVIMLPISLCTRINLPSDKVTVVRHYNSINRAEPPKKRKYEIRHARLFMVWVLSSHIIDCPSAAVVTSSSSSRSPCSVVN